MNSRNRFQRRKERSARTAAPVSAVCTASLVGLRVDLRGELAGRRENPGVGHAAPLREDARCARTSVQRRTHSAQM